MFKAIHTSFQSLQAHNISRNYGNDIIPFHNKSRKVKFMDVSATLFVNDRLLQFINWIEACDTTRRNKKRLDSVRIVAFWEFSGQTE